MDFKDSEERARLQREAEDIAKEQRELQYQIDNLEAKRKEILRKITAITPQDEQQILLERIYEQRRNQSSLERRNG